MQIEFGIKEIVEYTPVEWASYSKTSISRTLIGIL